MYYTEEDQELLNDLYDVGKTKAIGYLPMETLSELGLSDLNYWKDYAEEKSLKLISYTEAREGICTVEGGALYLYSEAMLLPIIDELRKANEEVYFPIDNSADFVTYIAGNSVSATEHPEVYYLIAKAYNDPRFRN